METSGPRNMQNSKIRFGFFRTVYNSFEKIYNSGSLLKYMEIDSLINYTKGSDYRPAVAGVGGGGWGWGWVSFTGDPIKIHLLFWAI